MTEDDYNAFLFNEADTLRAVFFREDGFLPINNPVGLTYSGFGNTFSITVSQNGIREIKIKSTPSKVNNLQLILNDFLRLTMLFEGSFLRLQHITFFIDNIKCLWSDLLEEELHRRLLAYFSSADFTSDRTNCFVDPFSCLSSELFAKWIDIEAELDIAHSMVLYGMSDISVPVDLKAAILIEAFGPLFELIKQHHSDFNIVPPLPMSNGGKDSKTRRQLESIIQRYGTDIFEKEIKKDIHLFCHVLVSSRNRIAHIKTNHAKLTLNGRESVLYTVKLSWLYRVVLLDLLGVSYSSYSDNLKNSIERWNSWEGILDFFLSTNWSDQLSTN